MTTRSRRLLWLLVGVLVGLLVFAVTLVGLRVRQVTMTRSELATLGLPTIIHVDDPWTAEKTYLRTIEETLRGESGVVADSFSWQSRPLVGDPITDEEWLARLPLIRQLPNLVGVILSGDVSRPTLETFSQFPSMRDIQLTNCPLTDADLAPLAELPELSAVWLHDMPITGTGLVVLKDSLHLVHLSLDGCDITEEGIDAIMQLQHLQSISLSNVGIAESEIMRLEEALPGVMISDD